MSYLFWRVVYVLIKPSCLLIAGRFISTDVANLMAIIITISAILMAALSFGTYRAYLNSGDEDRVRHGKHRANSFVLNVILVILVSIFLSALFGDWMYFLIITAVLLAEHLIHDESRVLLYSGLKVKWAKQNAIRTFFLYAALIMPAFISELMMLISVLAILGCLLLNSYAGTGLLSYFKENNKIDYDFWTRYREGFQYFKSSLVNKFGQQSDRVYFFVIAPESLWIYALLSQSASVMLTYFDVMHLAKFKSQLLSKKQFKFSYISFRQSIELFMIGFAVFIGVVVLGESNVLPEVSAEYLMLLLVLILGNFIVVTNTLNSERLFWSIKNPKDFYMIEVKSFVVGLAIVIPVLTMPALVLVRLPFLLGCMFKIFKAKQCLK